MKQQVLARKISVFIFTALLFIHIIHGVVYAELEFTEGEATTREVAENTPTGTNIGESLRFSTDSCTRFRLRGPDASAFDLVRVYRGVQLKTASTLDYETKDSYEVRVTITGAGDSDTIRVTINVIDVNEAPMFAEVMESGGVDRIHRSIPESTAAGTYIGDPISAIDPDGSDVDLTYNLGGIDANMFEIDNGTGQLMTHAPLDYEAFEVEPRAYFIDVGVSDGTFSTETEVMITVEPVNEFAPVFIEGDAATREIHEKENVGANIGDPVSATDMDIGEVLEYNLSDNNDDVFEIDSSTGQLRTKTTLDYQTKPVHTVKVLVSDGSQTDSIIVTVHVLADIVEVPDPTLASILRRRLGLERGADITKKTISELTTLNTNRPKPEIRDITGLEHATNLTSLYLDYNSINDITLLEGLTNLTTLHIEGNRVDRIGPLEGLTNLTSLRLSDNRVGSLEPLAGLTHLTELLLDSNRVADLTPIAGLTNLTTLQLSENYLEDLRSLAGLTNLRTLHLRNNRRLTNISPLAALVNLETLQLKGCPITDFSPLAGLTATLDIDVPGGSAPAMDRNSLDPAVLKTLDREILQAHLQRLSAESDGSLKYQRAIAVLDGILALMRPDKTVLLSNYPNPFNPETWIPYHLAKSTDVHVTIYNAHGTVVRHLELGHQSGGYYTSRSRSAYWDGRNDFGERVASGIYFYQLQADTVSPMRKMVILK